MRRITERRTRRERTGGIDDLADIRDPRAGMIRRVPDGLNTHDGAGRSEAPRPSSRDGRWMQFWLHRTHSLGRVVLIMRSFTGKSSLALLGLCFLVLAGCEDNEAAIKQQASKAKGTIPGSRSAQAQTQAEYYEITPGVRGAGMKSGPVPDQGAGYPDANTTPTGSSLMRLARPRTDLGTGSPGVKK
jgi:hypothetical protein